MGPNLHPDRASRLHRYRLDVANLGTDAVMDYHSLKDGDLVTLGNAPIGYRDKLVRVRKVGGMIEVKPVPTKERKLIEAANRIIAKYSKYE